jgi:hypothetical protein
LSQTTTGNTNQENEADADGTGAPARLADDGFFRAMAAKPRRRALYHVTERGGSTVDELATVLAGWEVVDGGTMAAPADRRRWEIELRHVHLPVLAEAGLVRYDHGSAAVDPADLGPSVVDLVGDSVAAERG